MQRPSSTGQCVASSSCTACTRANAGKSGVRALTEVVGGGTFFITVSSSAPRRLSALAIAELQDRAHRLLLCNSLGCRAHDPSSSMRMVSQPAVHAGRDLSAGKGLCTDAPGPVFLALSAIKQSLPISY